MIKFISSYIITLLFVSVAMAGGPDSLISVSSVKINCEFVYNAKQNRVEVKRTTNKIYTGDGYQLNLPFAEFYNDIVSIDDVTCKVDGHTPQDFKPRYSYYAVDDFFFSDEHICYFPITLPKKGSTANVMFAETITDPRYFTTLYFGSSYNTKLAEITIKIPRWMKADIKELNFGTADIKKAAVTYDANTDAYVITYTARNLSAQKQEDNSPGPSYVYPHLLILSKSATIGANAFTYFGTVTDQYNWYRELVKNTPSDKTVIDAKAKEITTGLAADMDKIKAILYYVQDNIRYIAFEDGIAGFKPEKADEVLRKKYGDCKGMANLTKSLLVALGYDARLCWLGTNHIAYDYQTPSMAVDNHMICGLNYQGKTIFLDATETYLGLNEYAERIQGRQVLMENGDKFVLTRVPVAAALQNYYLETSKLSITASALTGTVMHVWKGEDKEMMLNNINSTKKEKADQAMTRYLSNDNSNYIINDLKLSNTTDADKDLTATYNVENKNSLSVFSKNYYVDIDLKKELIDANIKTAERKNDFWFFHRLNINKVTELTIPPGHTISAMPQNLDITNPDYEFHINYAVTGDKLSYKKSILIKNTHLVKAKFDQWNKDIEQLAKTYNESIIIKPVTE
jgi:hypothetical protein